MEKREASSKSNQDSVDEMFQVMKAVEAAEATIKQQVKENNHLKAELQKRNEELERYKSGDVKFQNPHLSDRWGDHVNEPSRADQIVLHLENQMGGDGNADMNSRHLPKSGGLQTNLQRSNEDHVMQTQIENRQFEGNKVGESSNVTHGGQVATNHSGVSQIMSPSIAIFSPSRYPQDGELDSDFQYSGGGSISLAEVINASSSKQDIVVKIWEQEEEILQLKRYLSELLVKEARIRNEKYGLEKRISYMRQVEENNHLKAEPQKRNEELERYQDVPDLNQALAAEDDPLPAIEGLQISGDVYPGQQLQACGYSMNGTTSCNFEWVRHLENRSVNYVDGAKQPYYLVSADDVDTYLAVEVQPLDDRKRKGDVVTVFANEHKKIICGPEMHNYIEKTFYSGHASYNLSLSTGYLDIWEPAILIIKKDGYSIKSSGPSGVSLSEKFSSSTVVSITYGNSTDFSIVDSMGVERVLRVDTSSTDLTCARDTIVLTLRLFIFEFKLTDKQNKELGLLDKVTLSSWCNLLGNKYARTFALVYAIGLHILLLIFLYRMFASSYL